MCSCLARISCRHHILTLISQVLFFSYFSLLSNCYKNIQVLNSEVPRPYSNSKLRIFLTVFCLSDYKLSTQAEVGKGPIQDWIKNSIRTKNPSLGTVRKVLILHQFFSQSSGSELLDGNCYDIIHWHALR